MSLAPPNSLESKAQLDCPSAQPDMDGARPYGIICGSPQKTRIAFFKRSVQAQFDWRTRFADSEATKVLRFAARCEQGRCSHYSGDRCSLGRRVAEELPAVVDKAPSCLVRASCRWHAEQGLAACFRCPQVVTMIPEDSAPLNMVAMPR